MATKKDFTKFINTLSKEELAIELEKLYSKFKNVKEYYSMELTEDTSAILSKYKEALKREYFPNTKFGIGEARASVARKIISEFTKIKVFDVDLIELMLYRVELCVEFTKEFGDINEQFYTSTENAFEAVAKLIVKSNLEDTFKLRCKFLVDATADFGWGFADAMEHIYYQYFN